MRFLFLYRGFFLRPVVFFYIFVTQRIISISAIFLKPECYTLVSLPFYSGPLLFLIPAKEEIAFGT